MHRDFTSLTAKGSVTEGPTKAEKQQLIHIQNAVFSTPPEIGSM